MFTRMDLHYAAGAIKPRSAQASGGNRLVLAMLSKTNVCVPGSCRSVNTTHAKRFRFRERLRLGRWTPESEGQSGTTSPATGQTCSKFAPHLFNR